VLGGSMGCGFLAGVPACGRRAGVKEQFHRTENESFYSGCVMRCRSHGSGWDRICLVEGYSSDAISRRQSPL
jgi:hypothetical protein